MSQLLENALMYAEKAGWSVFPCKLDKSPYTKHGCKDATKDPDQIRAWWTKWPDASIGCACGPDSKIWVLDIDLPDGPDSLKKLIADNGELPETRLQQTGSGGMQYFFSWNGKEIKNTSGKLGHKIDTRGDGGYIIVPPSPHPSGGTYKWLKRVDMPHAPEWLSDLVVKKPAITHVSHPQQGGNSKYGVAALSKQIIELSGSGEGQRNQQLNTAAYSLGRLVSGGELEIGHVENSLIGVALAIGLPEPESRKTIQSGLKSGMQVPKKAPEFENDNYYADQKLSELSKLSNLSKLESTKQNSANSASLSNTKQTQQENSTIPPDNITAHIELFIKNSTGCFTTRDIDTEFGLKTRKEKNTRSWALNKMVKDFLINKDKAVAGKYHIIDAKIDWIDLDAPIEETFNIVLPFGLHESVLIPPKAIIIMAGSTNAGKTAFMLNTLKLNRQQKYKKTYLMSEMGSGEYVSRLKKFGEPLTEWKSIQAASKSCDFNGAIKHHNPDGLTCIDYLEEIQGEYFKIASNIRDIYDALDDGVAFIAIQKRSDQKVARGGEGTMEKSRLYLTLDHLCTKDHSIVCALSITKLKSFIGKNLQNHEMHFEITKGSIITKVMDWTPSYKVDRAKCAIEYERGSLLPDSSEDEMEPIYFNKSAKSKVFRIRETQIVQWGASFTNIEDVYGEVLRLSEQHNKKPFVTGFFHLGQIMAKLNKSKGSNLPLNY